MTIPAGSGVPQHSGIYTPEIWSGKMLVEYYTATVFGAIANTDYEGEIKKEGDTVHIRTLPEIEILDYVKGVPLNIQRPNPGKIELTIDHAKYFNIGVDDIDKFQSDLDYLNKWTTHGGKKLAIAQDRSILASVYADADPFNKGATAGKLSRNINLGSTGAPLAVTATNILDLLVDVGQVFSEQDVPEDQRKVVLPAWMTTLIKKSDLKEVSVSGDGTSMLRNGRVGMIDNMEIFQSNSLANVTDGADTVTNAMACHRDALTFAAQLTESRTFQAESTFGWFARSLVVYGFEVIKPEAMVHLYVKKG
jgi:hypothetical protein